MSLASATSTRVDSSSKHIVPCKVSTDYMASLIGDSVDNSMRELQVNKMKYCMHKDDIAIGLGRPMYGSSISSSRKKAYPSVIVTLASMEDEARYWIAIHNFLVSDYTHSSMLKEQFLQVILNGGTAVALGNDDMTKAAKKFGSDECKKRRIKFHNRKMPRLWAACAAQIENLLEFYFVGISLGMAYAHPHSGDTVASVMIGGLRTVLNGDFQVHTNDLLMFYWDTELELFEESGSRKARENLQQPDGTVSFEKIAHFIVDKKLDGKISAREVSRPVKERREYHDRSGGNYASGPNGKINGKMHVARIKPYIISRHLDRTSGNAQHFPMDKYRVFGKAISNAQPFEMVDIMLSRQSI